MPPTPRRLLASLGAAAAIALAGAAPAAASTACDPGPLTKPFTPWLDYADYAEVPGGDFEAGSAAWSVSGGAKVVAGNESYYVGGAGHKRSMYLPKGASITSPSFCGGVEYPTIRFFSKGGGLPLLSGLRVEVLYTDSSGLLRSSELGVVTPTSSWQPTVPALTLSGLPALTDSRMALRVTAVGASWNVDDVYVDPYSRR